MRENDNREQIVVSLTTWHARINNIPTVLGSILCQTVKPDHIVLNLAYYEVIPESVDNFIRANNIIVNRVEDTKVYKKLLPTLKLYPNDVVISIDDDFVYPSGMIADFIAIHRKHPHNPISGNRQYYEFVKTHCGCASLTKLEHFGPYIDMIDQDVMANCKSDDLVYTYFINKNGHHYLCTQNEYFINMQTVNPAEPYSDPDNDRLDLTWVYLQSRFGGINKIGITVKIYLRKIVRIFKRFCSGE